MSVNRILTVVMLFVACLTFASGCGGKGPGRYAVSGVVTMNGSPLSEGTVEFRGASNNANPMNGGATIGSDGKFAIEKDKGLTEGEYSVVFNVPDPSSEIVHEQLGQTIKNMKQIELEQKVTVGKSKNELQLEIPSGK